VVVYALQLARPEVILIVIRPHQPEFSRQGEEPRPRSQRFIALIIGLVDRYGRKKRTVVFVLVGGDLAKKAPDLGPIFLEGHV
jgi:hypothetical protein